MGKLIDILKKFILSWAKSIPLRLSLGGIVLTSITILISGSLGWLLERLILKEIIIIKLLGTIIITIGMASGIAAKSLDDSVYSVLSSIHETEETRSLNDAKLKLSFIVSRDVNSLNKNEILRAAAETASENSIDGIFSPLFWMTVGASLWQISPSLPGPLSLVLIFKATSTIDSMIGYKYGELRWLGTAGARLDDILNWIPCRLVAITMPLICKPLSSYKRIIDLTFKEGSKYQSPNAGISEAIFAHCTNTRMGGTSEYKGLILNKPILAGYSPSASSNSVVTILKLSRKLEFYWLGIISTIYLLLNLI